MLRFTFFGHDLYFGPSALAEAAIQRGSFPRLLRPDAGEAHLARAEVCSTGVTLIMLARWRS